MPTNDSQVVIGNLVEAQERERARIARELHDNVGQKLALIQMALDQIADSPCREHHRQVRQLSIQIAEVARDLHDVSHQLHPLRLDVLGLVGAIRALCRETSRQSGVAITFACDANVPHATGSTESQCIYRIAQEALHNVVKHSGATLASVHLVRRPCTLGLIVTDPGRGFDKSVTNHGLGLTSMRERVQLLNGKMAIRTSSGGGTRVYVRIPLDQCALRPDNCALPEQPYELSRAAAQ
ncbi:MAG TPA: sensor histidine kinase [Vicinamibacterales bacterium]|jgi:signal transduction histidine kinase